MPNEKISQLMTDAPATAPTGVEGVPILQSSTTKGMTLSQIFSGSVGTTLPIAVDDAAAAIAGVIVGGFYRNGSVVMVRVA